jgi:hypothetical protein
LDQYFVLRASADSVQRFNLTVLKKGMYKIKIEWSMEGEDYFIEEIVSI